MASLPLDPSIKPLQLPRPPRTRSGDARDVRAWRMTEARLTHLVAQLLGNREVIPFSPAVARAIGDVEATVFLCQACYWQSLVGPGKWFFKLRDAQRDSSGRLLPPVDGNRQSWEWETALSRTRQESARRRLKALGLLEEARKGVPAKMYYRVNLDRLTEFLLENNNQSAGFLPTGWQGPDHLDGGIRTGQSAGGDPTNTKTTSKNTHNTTTSARPSVSDRIAGARSGALGRRLASGSTTPQACHSEGVVVVDRWAEPHREVLMNALSQSQLGSEAAQLIADEFAGVLEAASLGKHRGIVSKSAWLENMIQLYKARKFRPDFCRGVQARRARTNAIDTDAVPTPSAPDVARTNLAQALSKIKTAPRTGPLK